LVRSFSARAQPLKKRLNQVLRSAESVPSCLDPTSGGYARYRALRSDIPKVKRAAGKRAAATTPTGSCYGKPQWEASSRNSTK